MWLPSGARAASDRPARVLAAEAAWVWARGLTRAEGSNGHLGWAALDVETTGLGPEAEPVEVAVVGAHGNLLFDSLVRPARQVQPAAARMHGLDDAVLRGAPCFAEIYEDLERALRDQRVIVAYYAVFDRAILAFACRSNRLPLLADRWDCAYARYAAWRGFAAPLRTACAIEGIPHSGPHRAAADARRVWQLVQRMGGSGLPPQASAPGSKAQITRAL
jgi:DNA polymerase III subunit epsilon